MIYELSNTQFIKGLNSLLHILDKSAQFADSKKIDMSVLLQSRLAADQFPLARQIHIVCDTAKLGASRLTGIEAPTHADDEKTYPEFKARIESVISYLQSLNEKNYEGSESKHISQPRWEGQYLTGHDYVVHHAVPNFYFHVTTAYSILRHNGVEVGKKDYLGALPFKK